MPATNVLDGVIADRSFPDKWIAYTAADSDATYVFNHVKCTVAGNVALRNYKDGVTVTMPIAVGEVITGRFDRIGVTGTTATGLFIGYCTP